MGIDILASGTRRANKDHACGWCRDRIQKGESHIFRTLVDKPMPPYTWREHLECAEAAKQAEAHHESDPEFGVCCNVDIDGGAHQRGENCTECSDQDLG